MGSGGHSSYSIKMDGPGILYVTSKISRPDIMTEDVYMDWYDNDHIAEIMQTSGIKDAHRYIDVNIGKVDKPYLAFYPMANLAFTQGEEFRKIHVHSKMLPGSGLCYDLADIDVRYYSLIQTYDPKGSKPGVTKCLAVGAIEPGDSVSAEEFEDWYRKEHLDMLAKAPGYVRTTRYKLVYARSNAQSRALKGLPTTDEKAPEPPTWLAIHEFDTLDLPVNEMQATAETEWSKRILGTAKAIEAPVYRHIKSFGEGKFFHPESKTHGNGTL